MEAVITIIVLLIVLIVVAVQLIRLFSQIKQLRADLSAVVKGVLERLDKMVIKANDVSDLLDIVVENTKKKPSTKKIVKECKTC